MKFDRFLDRALRLAALAAVIVVVWLLLCGAMREERQVIGYDYITGTSLWDLARECPDDMDKRDYIAQIVALNALQGSVVYADRLYQVPVYEE